MTTARRAARGYMLGESPVVRLGWEQARLGRLHLAHDPRIRRLTRSSGAVSVTVLGTFVDTREWLPVGVALQDAADALCRSESEFHDRIGGWAGRYVLFYGRDDDLRATLDATGMRSLLYTTEGPLIVGSHPGLVAEEAGLEPVRRFVGEFRGVQVDRLYGVGRGTPWDGVVFLTANVELRLQTREIRRVWPRTALPDWTVDEAAERLVANFRGQARALGAADTPVVVSLTAGLDSRVTLAMTRGPTDRFRYFTYGSRHPSHRRDVETARDLAATLGLQHDVIDLTDAPGDPAIDAALRDVYRHSNRQLVPELLRRYDGWLHLRSNVSEIGRRQFARLGDDVSVDTPEQMARVAWKAASGPGAVAVFAEWAEEVGFFDVEQVDRLDLFYWEHRMPVWHGHLLLETDVAVDTHAFFNCRDALVALLSVPVAARRASRVHHRAIELAWPTLARYGRAENDDESRP